MRLHARSSASRRDDVTAPSMSRASAAEAEWRDEPDFHLIPPTLPPQRTEDGIAPWVHSKAPSRCSMTCACRRGETVPKQCPRATGGQTSAIYKGYFYCTLGHSMRLVRPKNKKKEKGNRPNEWDTLLTYCACSLSYTISINILC